MMFTRLAVAVGLSATLAAAMPGGEPTKTVTVTATPPASTGSTCSTGDVQCCNSLESADSPSGSLLLGLLGIVVQGVDVVLGINCSPISVIGVGGGNCNSNVVCCQNNNVVRRLISIGCVPIIL
ncbi:fungal hydrophobin [Epithele typhae]|uniref:fungal hydrophobin n=1 Tax=Epithele typhae TaxID=378194 RepID=UPI0020083F3F|nr:fungal hydrophobin [Epithele typhae]KAH9919985.1 fungal hydrophobin [Epithele typhae]